MAKSILMLEDDEMISEIYKKQFEKSGYQVTVLASGEGVAQKIKKDQPDLALLDLLIPEGGGIAILNELKGWSGKTKKIIFSNNQDPEQEKEALALGADAFWIKSDFTPAKLIGEVEKII